MTESPDTQGSGLPEDPEGFEAFYAGTPPWDVGEPQPAFLALADAGALSGRVLDVGCGTGEHALLAAARGLEAVGIDIAPTAIERARAKAEQRGLPVQFVVGDVFRLPDLVEGTFDVVIDSALFHVFTDEQRAKFLPALAAVMPAGARYFLLCFSEHLPGTEGPRRISQDEIRATFRDGWRVDSVEPAQIKAVGFPDVPAWLATITRT